MYYAQSLEEIIESYNQTVKTIDHRASSQNKRAYGGLLRAGKGGLLEYITHSLILIAWKGLGGHSRDIDITKNKIHIPINPDLKYINNLEQSVREHILRDIQNYSYGLSVDKHVNIKNRFVLAIECKAYTENAMFSNMFDDS